MKILAKGNNYINYFGYLAFSLFLSFKPCLKLFGQGIMGVKGGNFIGADLGLQMTGIRQEDFVLQNFAPKLNLYIGKRINPYASIQVGYEGFFFNTIANTDNRHYNYFNLKIENQLISFRKNESTQKQNYLAIQLGGGLFQNLYYNRPNFCADVGLVKVFFIENKTNLVFRLNSILGWDIYQGDEDIINSLTVGFKRIL